MNKVLLLSIVLVRAVTSVKMTAVFMVESTVTVTLIASKTNIRVFYRQMDEDSNENRQDYEKYTPIAED
jgi:hypothetical protein